MRTAVFVLALAVLSAAPQARATPDSSQWRRMTLLGVSDVHYFAYVVEKENPGSYYDYTVRVVIEKYHTKTNRQISRAVVRETAYHLPDPEKRTWTHQDKKHPPLELGAYFVRENIHALFPENWKRDMGVAYVQGGLYLTRGKKSVLLRKLGASRLVEDDDTRIAAIFIGEGYAFIVVQQGELYLDMDYVQKILPVSLKVYNKVVNELFDDK